MQQFRTSPTVDRVVAGELCSGCGLCAGLSAGAIKMESVSPGYNRPLQLNEISADVERSIAAACPGATVQPWVGEEAVHPYWGPWRRSLTGAANDEEVRYRGSSGGALSALLIRALDTGLVDRVIHVGAHPSEPTRNATFVSRTVEEVLRRAGSRYVSSSPLAVIDEALEEGGSFAFVGKPCDVSALQRLRTRDPRVDRHVRLTLSFFCGGIPSEAGVTRILDAFGVKQDNVTDFRFRGQGWPGDCVATTAAGESRMSYAESWGGHLSKEVQFRCKICPDAVGGAADIACADAWYGDDSGYPKFDEEEGRSLIVTRSLAGDALVDDAVQSGRLNISDLPIDEIERMQPSQAKRKRLVLARVLALILLHQPRPRYRGLSILTAARRSSLRDALQNTLGTMRRTVRGTRSRL